MAYYYPEGYFGPICDPIIVTTTEVVQLQREKEDDTSIIWGPYDPNDTLPIPLKTECKVDPNTGELYDCVTTYDDKFTSDYNGTTCLHNRGSCFNWRETSTGRFGLQDDFFVPDLTPESCNPYLPDVNIRPQIFVKPDGTKVTKYPVEKSNPVTYPVNAAITDLDPLFLNVKFAADGNSLEVEGDFSGQVELTLEWDDNPNTNGTAVDTITLGGQTWTQSGEEGSESNTISVIGGQSYPISYTGLHPDNNPIKVEDNGARLCLKDGDGNDCNANFKVSNTLSGAQIGKSLWSSTGDAFAVWTNPMQCTLPCKTQEVTYIVNFPTAGIYYFEAGADNSARIFLDEETAPFMDFSDGIILAGRSSPHVSSRTLTAGNHKIVVQCTNSPLGTRTSEQVYVDTTGFITTTAGTAIYTEESGIANTDGTDKNELGGFAVPSDSPTGKYLSFGTYEATSTTVATRTASMTLDLTNVNELRFSVIAGTDDNGGERPNDDGEDLEVNINGGGWVPIAQARRSIGLSFDDYDATYGTWREAVVKVLKVHRVNNATVSFRSTADGSPELAGTYGGLSGSAAEAAYANSGDVYGIYRITKVSTAAGDCANLNADSHDWDKNPGGWFIKICQNGPCGQSETLDWNRVTRAAWSNFMNTYAVWPSTEESLQGQPQTITYNITVTETDTYTLEYAGDNEITIVWDGTQVAQLTGDVASHYTTDHSTTFAVTPGVYQLTMTVTNVSNGSGGNWVDNPAGGAWLLKNSNSDIIRSSADMVVSADGNMIWHTRLATGYNYVEI